MITARLLTGCLNTATSIYYVRKLVGIHVSDQLRVGLRPVLSGAAMATVLLMLRPLVDASSGAQLLLVAAASVGAGLVTYTASMLGLWCIAGGRLSGDRPLLQALARSIGALG